MVIYFRASGYMRSHFKEEKYEIELNDNATIRDLFEEIHKLLGKNLSRAIWDHDKKCFRGPVMVKVDGSIERKDSYRLSDGQNVEISRLLVGG